MGAIPVAPSAALYSLREAKLLADGILEGAQGDAWALMAGVVASIDRCLDLYWNATYAQDKADLEEEVQAALDSCDAMDEVHGPNVSRIRELLANAQVEIQSWITEAI